MPKAKERKSEDKIKKSDKKIKKQDSGKGGRPIQEQARRVMTAKMRKELAQQRRAASGSSAEPVRSDTSASSTTEAVEQVEQTAGASVQRVGQQVKQGVSRTVTKAKQERQKGKERQDRPKEPEQPPEAPAPKTPETVIPERQEIPSPETGQATAPPPPTRRLTASVPRPASASAGSPVFSRTKPVKTFENTIIPKTKPADSLAQDIKTPDTSIYPARQAKRSICPSASLSRTKEPFAPKARPAETRTDPPVPQIRTAEAAAVPPPPLTPEDQMRQLSVDKRKELARQPKPSPALPKAMEPPSVAHYGKTATDPGTSVTSAKSSFENQSIHPSIKERPRSTAILKEKHQGWTMAPRTRQGVEQPAKSTAVQPKVPGPVKKETIAQRIRDRARRKAQKEAQRGMAQGSKKTTKAAASLSKKAAAASTKAVKDLISALSALVGGGTLAAALCVIFLIAAVIASPFGLLFSNEPSPGAVPLNVAVTQINVELTDKLALLQTGDYDSVDVQGSGPDWREVAAVFAVKTSLGADGLDVAALTPDRVNRLKAVFWDMCEITTSVETIDHPASGSTEAWTETILHITIAARTADDMRIVYAFTPEQNRALTELLAELNGIGTLLGDLGISQEDAAELLRRLPEDLPPERWAVVETACKLVGKINYFWGGKSLVLGWDSRWGTIQKVWAAGSPSTGTYRPYGMDCSGFVDWVFYNMSGGSYVIGHGGGARMQHSYCTPISWSQAQPGDLVFYPEDTHVGIVGGWDASGNVQIIHCASGQNNVVITGKAGFTTIGRPNYYG